MQAKSVSKDVPNTSKMMKKMPKMPSGWKAPFVSVRQRLLEAVCAARSETDTGAISRPKRPGDAPTSMLAAYTVKAHQQTPSVEGTRGCAEAVRMRGASLFLPAHAGLLCILVPGPYCCMLPLQCMHAALSRFQPISQSCLAPMGSAQGMPQAPFRTAYVYKILTHLENSLFVL